MERNDLAKALKNVRLEGFVWPEPDDSGDLRIIKDVIECGCHIVAVEGELGHPRFAYSIGLYLNYLHPEVIVAEMDHATAGRTINRIAARLKNGDTLACGVPYCGFHDSVPLMFQKLRMEDHTEELGFAIWFYCSRSHGLTFPVYQALWPDRSGRFPAEDQCDPRVVRAQTLKRK